jgi:hypothetical protein
MSSAANEIKLGSDALTYFHNQALRYPDNYSMSFEQLKEVMSKKSNGQFLSGLGFAIETAKLPERDVRESMERLADAGEGKIPVRWNDFFNALNRDPSGFSFDAFIGTVKDTASDIGEGLVQVGGVAKDTLKAAGGYVTYLPLMAFLGLGAFIWFRVKK